MLAFIKAHWKILALLLLGIGLGIALGSATITGAGIVGVIFGWFHPRPGSDSGAAASSRADDTATTNLDASTATLSRDLKGLDDLARAGDKLEKSSADLVEQSNQLLREVEGKSGNSAKS